MFAVLIHDEFNDSPPEVWESFDNLTDAFGYYNAMRNSSSPLKNSDGCELVVNDEGHFVHLDYFKFEL